MPVSTSTIATHKFRPACGDDIRKILALEAMLNESLIQLSKKELIASLHGPVPNICLVAESTRQGSVDAYVLYYWKNTEHIKSQDLHVFRLVVHPDERYGPAEKGLFDEMKKRVIKSRGTATFLCRERELGQQVILASTGWKAIEVFRGFFLDNGEDAYQFEFTESQP